MDEKVIYNCILETPLTVMEIEVTRGKVRAETEAKTGAQECLFLTISRRGHHKDSIKVSTKSLLFPGSESDTLESLAQHLEEARKAVVEHLKENPIKED